MAGIPITEVLGTTVYLCAEDTVITDATDAAAALAAGKKIAFLQELGSSTESKPVTNYTELEGVESQKALGSKTFGNMQLNVLYDAADALGQADIIDMWDNSTRREILIVLSDDGGTSPSYVTFTITISEQEMSFEKDNAVMYNNVAEQTSSRFLIKAVV